MDETPSSTVEFFHLFKVKNFFKHSARRSDLGMDAGLTGMHFFSDVSRIVPNLGAPFVIFGPGEDIVERTINEKVSLSSVVDVARALTLHISGS